jgi:hypothetical protein
MAEGGESSCLSHIRVSPQLSQKFRVCLVHRIQEVHVIISQSSRREMQFETVHEFGEPKTYA